MTENKTYSIELTMDEIGMLYAAAMSFEGASDPEAMRKLADSLIKKQLEAEKLQ